MRLLRNVFFVGLILLSGMVSVKGVFAEESSIRLTLDSGFVGRPVDFDLFGGAVRLEWGEGVLVRETVLTVRLIQPGVVEIVSSEPSFSEHATMKLTFSGGTDENTIIDSNGIALQTTKVGESLTAIVNMSQRMVLHTETIEGMVEAPPMLAPGIPLAQESLALMLDQGFVARPVSLELFDGELTLDWDEKTLTAPTMLRVQRFESASGTDSIPAAKSIQVEFDQPNAISKSGVVTIHQKAFRPPSGTEQVVVHLQRDSDISVSAQFMGESISYDVGSCSSFLAHPFFEDGMMRTGKASWYKYKQCLCAASPDVPKGTRMKVWRTDDPSVFTVVTINDWGPDRSIHPDRVIDLDYVAFQRIANPRDGLTSVSIEVLPPEHELYALGNELPPPPWRW